MSTLGQQIIAILERYPASNMSKVLFHTRCMKLKFHPESLEASQLGTLALEICDKGMLRYLGMEKTQQLKHELIALS